MWKKFNNKKTYIIILLLIIPSILVCVFYFFGNNRKYSSIKSLSVFVDSKKEISHFTTGDFVKFDSNENIDLYKFSDIVKHVELNLNLLKSQTDFQVFNPFDSNVKYNINFPKQEQQEYEIVYDKSTSTLYFRKTPQVILLNSETITDGGINIYKIDNLALNDIIKIADKYILINKEGKISNISESYLQNPKIEKLTISNVNILAGQNESFQDGSWQPNVLDCEKDASGAPSIDMSIVNDEKSLRLAASSHSACTYKEFSLPTNPIHDVIFSIDYNNTIGNSSSVYLNFVDRAQKKVYDEIGNEKYITQNRESVDTLLDSQKSWQTYTTIIPSSLPNPFLLDVYLYTRSISNEKEETLFDNLRLNEVTSKSVVELQKIKEDPVTIKEVNLKKGYNNLIFLMDNKNLISNDNYSFEQGLWQPKATDCSDYMSGNPDFETTLSTDSTEGHSSLELTSRNHYACVYRKYKTDFSNSKIYKLSFDYKIINGKNAQYFINTVSQSDEHVKASFSEMLSGDDNKWHTVTVNLDSFINDIQYLEVYFYAPSSGELSRVLYDNIRIQQSFPRNYSSYTITSDVPNSSSNENLNYTSFVQDQVQVNSNTPTFIKTNQNLSENSVPGTSLLKINDSNDTLMRIDKSGTISIMPEKYEKLKYLLIIYFIFVFLVCLYYFFRSQIFKLGLLVKFINWEMVKFGIIVGVSLSIFLIGIYVNSLLAAIIALTLIFYSFGISQNIVNTLSFVLVCLSGIFFLLGNTVFAENFSIAFFLWLFLWSFIEIGAPV